MKSFNPCQSVIQTIKVHGGVPIAIGMKVETLSADLSVRNVVKTEATAQAGKEGEGSEFIIQLRTTEIK